MTEIKVTTRKLPVLRRAACCPSCNNLVGTIYSYCSKTLAKYLDVPEMLRIHMYYWCYTCKKFVKYDSLAYKKVPIIRDGEIVEKKQGGH